MSFTVIGNYTPSTIENPEVIERDFFRQGYIFKDGEAFYKHLNKPCYVPELSDTVYTRQGFIDLCGGREDFAVECFETVDWQHPETWVDEQFAHGEWDECQNCGHWYDRHGDKIPCAECGSLLEYEGGI
jgi:hypothetical protein